MIALAPPAAYAPAADTAPLALDDAFVLIRQTVRPLAVPPASPSSILTGPGTTEAKLAAIDALSSRLPTQKKAQQIAGLNALMSAASSPAQPPEVRAKAVTFLGYALPVVDDDAARARGLRVILAELNGPYRLFALRGLGPASHFLPKADEALFQNSLLDLLDGPVSGEDRQTAWTALFAFVAARDDLFKRDPALVRQFDDRVTAVVEAGPAAFTRDPRNAPGARAIALAAIFWSARHRLALGDPAPAARANAILDAVAAVETDPMVRGWIANYRNAAPPSPFRASTTNRGPAGPDEP